MSRSIVFAASLGILLVGGIARAELTQTDGRVALQASSVTTPARGSSMAQVEARFGAPQSKHEAVGSPPITRWDYPQFTVFFEFSHVIHAVVH